jgi:hypothetical protein
MRQVPFQTPAALSAHANTGLPGDHDDTAGHSCDSVRPALGNDVSAAPRLAGCFDVRAIPILVVLRDGQVAARRARAAGAGLRSWVEQAIAA